MKFENLISTIEEQMCHYGGVDVLIEAHQELVLESLFDIDEDVDYLFDELGVSDHLEEYAKNPRHLYDRGSPLMVGPIRSGDLPSEVSDRAHDNKPIKIYLVASGPSHYNPAEGKLYIALNSNAIDVLGKAGLGNKEIIAEYPNITNEFSAQRIKGTIAHELTHWLEEALYENKVSKALSRVNVKPTPRDMVKFRNTSPHEIESFIHQMSQVKRGVSEKDWDKLSFVNLFNKHSSLRQAYRNATSKLPQEDLDEFSKEIVRKMNREGLLGKNMRTPKRDIKFASV